MNPSQDLCNIADRRGKARRHLRPLAARARGAAPQGPEGPAGLLRVRGRAHAARTHGGHAASRRDTAHKDACGFGRAFWPEGYDPRVSAGFLQMLLGHQPNWSMPDVFRGLPRAPQRGRGELATAALTALALCSITSRSAVNRSVIRMSMTFWRNLSGSPSRADLPAHAPA